MKNSESSLIGFKRTSHLTEGEIVLARKILAGRQPFNLYLNSAIKDLARGYDNRWFHLNSNRGIVMFIDFNDLRVFSVIGEVDYSTLQIIAANRRRSEFHVPKEISETLCSLGAKRLLRCNTLKYYLLEREEPFEVELKNIRRLTPNHQELVKRFYTENYDGTIFSDWMLEMPFYGYFIGDELVSAGGCVAIDEIDKVANVGNFLTKSIYRGKGLAKEVTKALLNDLFNLGIFTFTLGTTEENIAAWKAYESIGFSLLERRIELEFSSINED